MQNTLVEHVTKVQENLQAASELYSRSSELPDEDLRKSINHEHVEICIEHFTNASLYGEAKVSQNFSEANDAMSNLQKFLQEHFTMKTGSRLVLGDQHREPGLSSTRVLGTNSISVRDGVPPHDVEVNEMYQGTNAWGTYLIKREGNLFHAHLKKHDEASRNAWEFSRALDGWLLPAFGAIRGGTVIADTTTSGGVTNFNLGGEGGFSITQSGTPTQPTTTDALRRDMSTDHGEYQGLLDKAISAYGQLIQTMKGAASTEDAPQDANEPAEQ